MAVRWSTGRSKKPWIWPECRSTDTMRSAPAACSRSATQLGGDGLAALGLAVLAAVAVVGADHGDALGRRPLGGVDHDELLHDRGVDGLGVALDDEHVAAPHRLVEAAVDLAVGEAADVGVAELDAEVRGDRLGQRGVRGAASTSAASSWRPAPSTLPPLRAQRSRGRCGCPKAPRRRGRATRTARRRRRRRCRHRRPTVASTCGAVADDAVDEAGAGPDLGGLAHHGGALEHDARGRG